MESDGYELERQLPRITAADVPEGGIVCPQCGFRHWWTTRTEHPVQGVIRRRKTCRRCGYRAVTIEQMR